MIKKYNKKLLLVTIAFLSGCASQTDLSQKQLRNDVALCDISKGCSFKMDSLDLYYKQQDDQITGKANLKVNGSAVYLFTGQVHLIQVDQNNHLCQQSFYFSGGLYATNEFRFNDKSHCLGNKSTIKSYNLIVGDGEYSESYRQSFNLFQ